MFRLSQSVCVGVAVLLVMTLAISPATAQSVSVGSGFELGNALLDQTITDITVTKSINLNDYASVLNSITAGGASPYVLQRSVTVSGSRSVTLDLAYIAGLFTIASGNTLTLRGLRVARAESGIPVGIVLQSPGATIAFDGSADALDVCAPTAFATGFFLNVPRPIPGTNTGTFNTESGQWDMSDVALTVPATRTNLGGYVAHWFNGAVIQCGSTVPLPASCNGVGADAFPSQQCTQDVTGALAAKLCTLPQCINQCRTNCARRR